MLTRLLLLFVIVPFVELTLLLFLAEYTGTAFTLGLIVVTGIAGAILAKSQGFRAYRRIHEELSSGKMPGRALADAAMILVAGALLLTPGILTDLVGFSLLIPFFRSLYAMWFLSRFRVQTYTNVSGFDSAQINEGQVNELDIDGRGDKVIDSYVIDSKPESESTREN